MSAFPNGLNEIRQILLRGLLLQTPTLQEDPSSWPVFTSILESPLYRMRETQETAPPTVIGSWDGRYAIWFTTSKCFAD